MSEEYYDPRFNKVPIVSPTKEEMLESLCKIDNSVRFNDLKPRDKEGVMLQWETLDMNKQIVKEYDKVLVFNQIEAIVTFVSKTRDLMLDIDGVNYHALCYFCTLVKPMVADEELPVPPCYIRRND